jgi:hypothetical protein
MASIATPAYIANCGQPWLLLGGAEFDEDRVIPQLQELVGVRKFKP